MISGSVPVTYLYTRNTNADMSSLNHADIVCSITDSKQRSAGAPLDQLDDESLLQR